MLFVPEITMLGETTGSLVDEVELDVVGVSTVVPESESDESDSFVIRLDDPVDCDTWVVFSLMLVELESVKIIPVLLE
jgi:hypothetical protein